jgi:hypothetical protein
MEITIKEDKETLDGATINQVRDMFNNWLQSDEAKAENNNTHYKGLYQFPRYTSCVYVDADAIDFVVRRGPQPPEIDFDEIGYATLMRLDHWDYVDDGSSNEHYNEEEENGEDE